MIRSQVQQGDRVSIWTVCARENPYPQLSEYAKTLHERWETGAETVAVRRKEDIAAAAVLGAEVTHLNYYDVIYRRLPDGSPIVTCDIELFLPPEPTEVDEARHILAPFLDSIPAGARVVGPLTMGGHRDHRLMRILLEERFPELLSFADYPYIALYELDIHEYTTDMETGYQVDVSEEALRSWQDAVAQYASQISSFWKDEADMREQLGQYWLTGEGCRLWKKRP
jgi:LmbE family N-acetylglucosaminyl deacetylase